MAARAGAGSSFSFPTFLRRSGRQILPLPSVRAGRHLACSSGPAKQDPDPLLAQELAPSGVRVGTVTIAGVVAEGTPFAPARVADAFLALHRSPSDPATAEIVFRK